MFFIIHSDCLESMRKNIPRIVGNFWKLLAAIIEFSNRLNIVLSFLFPIDNQDNISKVHLTD